MQKIYKKIVLLIFFFVVSCGDTLDDVKKGLGGQKRVTTDEFLVKKKDPLTLPPKFDVLPRPGEALSSASIDEEVTDIEELIQSNKNQTTQSIQKDVKASGSLENSILKQIKKK